MTYELRFGRELGRLTSAEHKIEYGVDKGRREDKKLEGFESVKWAEIEIQCAHRNQTCHGTYG